VAFTPGREAEDVAEAIVAHADFRATTQKLVLLSGWSCTSRWRIVKP
jgi:hypothetical protein